MTPQEQQLLMQLTQRINQTQLQEKDQDAQNLLGRELGANPDALYIMAQTMVVQNMALEQLKSQVAQLQQQLQQARQQPAHTTSFLGRLLGEHDQPSVPAQPQYQQPQQQGGWQPVPQSAPPQYQQAPPQYVQAPYGQPQYVAAPAGQPSFFRGAMQTAAGVAAGALAFEGVESLLHGGFGHGGGWGGPAMGMGMGPGMGFGGGFERPVEETVVNNYYDSPGQMGEHRVEHDYGAGGGQNFGSGDLHNEGGERHFQNTDGSGAVYSDADYTTTGADGSVGDQNAGAYDQGGYDRDLENDSVTADNSLDNMQIDDSGSGGQDDSGSGFDDGGGGFDDGGGGFDSGGDSGF